MSKKLNIMFFYIANKIVQDGREYITTSEYNEETDTKHSTYELILLLRHMHMLILASLLAAKESIVSSIVWLNNNLYNRLFLLC